MRVTGVKDTSGSGNVYADVKLTTASGNVYQNQLNFWVSVYDTYCNIRFDRDAYELITGDTAYLDLYPQFSMTLHQVERLIYVDDPSVAQVYDSQYVRAVAPGTANIICRVVFEDGTYVENRAPVTVRGMKLAWADGSDEPVTLQVDGEPVRLATAVEWYPEDIGYANGGVWDSYNSNVVSIDWETGEMTAVAPGTAVISFTQQAMYEGGYGSESTIYRTVIVEGENPPVSLSETQITLAGESKHQLEVIVHDDSHGELTEVRWNAWDHTLVDENGLVSVNSDYRVFYGTVTATAVFEDGFEYTATCTVKVNPRRFNLYGWQFSIAGWTWMAYNSMYAYRDMVEVFDNNVDVEMTFESSDESIATVDENGNIYSYDKAGDADITMTLKGYVDGVYTGESYVRNFRVRVEVDTTPSWIEYGNNKTWVLPLQYDYYLPYEVEAYTSFRPSMSTDNVDVATFAMSDSTQVLINGTGEANLTMAVEGHPEIRDTAKVIIVDPSRFSIAAEDGRTEFSEDEEVQLVVNGLEGLEDEVSTICWYSEACNDDFNMESDGLLVALGNYDNGELSSVSAEIIFNCGTSISVPAFSFDIVW